MMLDEKFALAKPHPEEPLIGVILDNHESKDVLVPNLGCRDVPYPD
jgi:hypothetical protein